MSSSTCVYIYMGLHQVGVAGSWSSPSPTSGLGLWRLMRAGGADRDRARAALWPWNGWTATPSAEEAVCEQLFRPSLQPRLRIGSDRQWCGHRYSVSRGTVSMLQPCR